MMKTVVIIPTYNERDNIGILVSSLEREISQIDGHEFLILVVDDNSPDGTQEIVRELMGKNSNIRLITGEKRGLGAAYIRGIQYAMSELDGELVVTMDADLSHDPRDVKRLLSKIDEGFDYVIGSRYVSGGSTPADWGWNRKFLSLFGNIVARIFGVWKVRDQTPAFRAIRVDTVISRIDWSQEMPYGYAFQINLICLAEDLGIRFAEVPIQFKERQKGKSKLPSRAIFETLNFLVKYRLRKVIGNK